MVSSSIGTSSDSGDETFQRRQRAIQMHRAGKTKAEISRVLGVSTTTISKYLRSEPPSKNTRSVSGRAQSSKAPSNNEVQLATRIEQAFTLRLGGLSYRQIAVQMALDPRTVRTYVERELETRVAPKVQDYRELESARLDHYLERLRPKIEAGDIKAIDVALRVSVRRSRLLGLDSPIRVDMIRTEVTQEDLAYQELLNEATARNANIRQDIVDARVLEDERPALPAGSDDAGP